MILHHGKPRKHVSNELLNNNKHFYLFFCILTIFLRRLRDGKTFDCGRFSKFVVSDKFMSYRGLTSMFPVATPTAKPTAGTMTVRRAAISHMSKPPFVVPLVYLNSFSIGSGSEVPRRYLTRDSDSANKRLVRSAGERFSSLIIDTVDRVTQRRGRKLRATTAGLDAVDRRTGKGDETKAVFIFLICSSFVRLPRQCLNGQSFLFSWLLVSPVGVEAVRYLFENEWRCLKAELVLDGMIRRCPIGYLKSKWPISVRVLAFT